MWVASAMHPAHVVYDGTTKDAHCAAGYTGPVPFDQCASGTSYSFTFTKAGEWKYHNHVNASQFGSVTVQ
jgi:plastocyanin